MEECLPPPPASTPGGTALRMFWCNQQSQMTEAVRAGVVFGAGLDKVVEHKAAMPPFNHREGTPPLPRDLVCYNVPVYGSKMKNAVMALFTPPVRELAAELELPLPVYGLDHFVVGKTKKIVAIVDAAKARADCQSGENQAATARLEAFCAAFSALTDESVDGPEAWGTFVQQHVVESAKGNWLDRLEFGSVLQLFGFSDDVAAALRALPVEVTDKKTGEKAMSDLTKESLRWLPKALAAYGPMGCFGDIVNLAFAALGKDPAEPCTEAGTIGVLQQFGAVLADPRKYAELWVPEYLIFDGESDDIMSLIVLEYMHKLAGTKLTSLFQLPVDDVFDPLAAKFAERTPWTGACRVYRDPDSGNGKAISGHFKLGLDVKTDD